MSVKLYYDLLSQPSRAVYIFLKKCNIPFEAKIVNVAKGEQFKEGYEKINPFRKVPAIEHNGFNLTESVAIMRYLCREFKVDDHWYPKDSKARARVDEYLEWQHLNTRLHNASYFLVKFLYPMLKGKPPKPEKVSIHESRMVECLDQIENVWLNDNKLFLTGQQISIADLLGACEIEQPRMAGFDPLEGRPKLSSWYDRVVSETSPFYEEAHVLLNKLANGKGKASSKL
ncbi:glutathione S-transferase theta-1 isoform X3 [Copidosoma floridanum]|nr:glutathione S-transferase theta-1 isoform X3 [Copidosoma floridanum]